MPAMVPVDMSVEDVHAAAGLAPGTDVPAAPEVNDLDNWSQEAYSLSVSTASDLGFPVGNITASFKREALMFGSSRWKDVVNGGHTYRFGVALRAIVVVSDILGSGALTLPVVAAKVELEGARASAQLLVRGYKCNALGDLLPAWQSFGVDAYGQYMKSVSDLQKEIMGDAQNVVPELLATTVVARPVPAAGEAVGSVYALHAIAEGATLAHALDKLGINDSAISGAAKVLYQSRIGDDERAVPDTQQRQDALDELDELSHQPELVQGLIRVCGTESARLSEQDIDRDFTACDAGVFNRFFAHYLASHGQGGTNTGQRNLRHLFTWLEETCGHLHPWTSELQRYAPAKKRPSTLAQEFIADLLEVTGSGRARRFEDVRDHAMIRVLTEGVRRTKLIQLQTMDLSTDLIAQPFVRVVPLKGGREYADRRIVPLTATTARAVVGYLRVRRSHRLAGIPALWLGTRNRAAMTGSGLYQMLQRRAEQAGYDPDVQPHLPGHPQRHAYPRLTAGQRPH